MRVTGGIFKGRLLKTLKGRALRPATDMVRQAVFNIIGRERTESAKVLDLFAGTGAYGIEALSRGAEYIVFVEKDRKMCEIIRENVQKLSVEDKVMISRLDAIDAINKYSYRKDKYSLLFADPPYGKEIVKKLIELIDRSEILKDDGIVMIEHSKSELPEEEYERLKRWAFRRYGDTCISIYKVK
jgi:16S rRNA (guanine(966)-N(2))-methyltransferase RsmD